MVIARSDEITVVRVNDGPKGDKGDTGADGQGISSITIEFYLSTSKTAQTGGSWTTTQPTWSAGKYLWTRQKIVYKNPASTVYTTPQCDSSWEAVNEVDVGGRNLLLKSASYDGTKILVGATNINLGSINVTPGEQITVSFDIKSDTAQTNKQTALMQYFDSNSKRIESENVWVFGNVKTEYSRISLTDTVPANAETFKLGLRSSYGVANTYARIKVEKGNKATDWTPAPEDVQEGIDNAQSTADNAQNSANDANIAASGAQSTADQAKDAADAAGSKADSAISAAETADEIARQAQEAALEAQAASDTANRLASGAMDGLEQLNQVFYADATGAHVKAAGTENETVVQSDGMHVMVGTDEVARFTKDDSHVDNLAIARFLMFGAHRAEIYTDNGEEGTGFFWIGDVK